MEKSAVITVLGRDRKGIIAAVSHVLADCDVNILDINQTILGEMFTMVMLVDYRELSISFDELQDQLKQTGTAMGLDIRMQRKEIFDAMHKI